MLYCIDTSVVIDILRGDSKLKDKINKLSNASFSINPIILLELFKGAYLAQQREQALSLVEEFKDSVDFLEFSADACRMFGDKYASLTNEGRKIQEADLMIGCIAMANNAVVMTRNPKDFSRIPGLKMMEI